MCHPVDPYVGMQALMYELRNDSFVRYTIEDYSRNHAHQLGLRVCLLFAVVPPTLRSHAPYLHRQAEDSSCNGQTPWRLLSGYGPCTTSLEPASPLAS